MSRLALNISANLLSNVWSTLIALLLTPWYVKLLGVESYGLIGFYGALLAILGILDTGISATALRQIAWLNARDDDRPGVPTLLRTLEIAYWLAIGAIALAMLSGAWWFGAGWFQSRQLSEGVMRQALVFMCVSVAIQIPSGLYVGGLMGLQRQVECSWLIAVFGTVRALGAVVLLLLVAADVRVFFAWQVVASCLQTGVTRWALWRHVATIGPPTFSPRILHSIRGFAGGMTLITALSVITTQADKVILTRLVSLEAFGFYALAWTVASGLSRVATPLIQAFSPRFTELVATGDYAVLASNLRMASQLTSAFILPPAALLILLPKPILLAWLGDPVVARESAPLLQLLVLGIVLSASSYPALSVLYSRNRIPTVIAITSVSGALMLPLTIFAVRRFGATGAAVCWMVNGAIMYVAYQIAGLRDLPDSAVFRSIARDLVVPASLAFAVAGATLQLHGAADGRLQTIAVLLAGLCVGWAAVLALCTDTIAMIEQFKWKTARVL
jgi:O-antigen/teichoic acid export membrane protein